jgi:hypothetical protein
LSSFRRIHRGKTKPDRLIAGSAASDVCVINRERHNRETDKRRVEATLWAMAMSNTISHSGRPIAGIAVVSTTSAASVRPEESPSV